MGLYNIVLAFFNSVRRALWSGTATDKIIFRKTLGIQACFDFLKFVTKEKGENFAYEEVFFDELLQKFSKIDFSDDFFGVQSKVRSRIKNCFLVGSGMKEIEDLNCSDQDKKRIHALLSASLG